MYSFFTSFNKVSVTGIALLVLTSITMCKKSENPVPVTILQQQVDAPNGKLVLQNNDYKNSRVETVPKAHLDQGYFYIAAQFSYGESVNIVIGGSIPGNYKLGLNQRSHIVYNYNSISYTTNANSASGSTGSIIITEIDKNNKTISGTFSFTAYSNGYYSNSAPVSGSFNKIPYTDTPLPKQAGKMELSLGSIPLTGTPVAVRKNTEISISASLSNGGQLLIELDENRTGTFQLGSSYYYRQAVYTINGTRYSTSNYSYSNAGSVTITELNAMDQTISGTFSFNASISYYSGTVYVTNGTFSNVPYTTY